MDTPTEPVTVVDPDPQWPATFRTIRDRVLSVLRDLAVAVEHVGSTAVPGLAAKPVVDLDVVVPSRADVLAAIDRLARIGYVHQGDLGVAGREAFDRPAGTPPHHLYVCVRDGVEHRRHVVFRDHLRAHPKDAAAYAALKRDAARRCRDDRAAYTDAKTAFVEEILRRADAAGKV